MGVRPRGKVRDLRRLAGRATSRSTVRWSRLRAFLGFCLLAAVVGGLTVDLPRAQVTTAAAEVLPPPDGPASRPQTIAFDQPSDTTVGRKVTLSASSVTTTTSSEGTGLLVSFRSVSPDVCTVSGTTVTATTADVCTVTASQGGSARYAPARPVQRSFQAHTGTRQQTITFTRPRNALVGETVTLAATTDADGRLDVSFRSESPTVCTVSDSTATTVAAGICAITAYQGGTATYAAAQASGSFQVKDPGRRVAQRISFGPVPGTTVGVPVVLTASSWSRQFTRADWPTGLAVSYSSQNRRVCTVSGATVVPRTGGRCAITATQGGSARYLPAEPVTQEFAVARAAQAISFTPPASATIDQPVTLTATASSWLEVTYTSSTLNVCAVSGHAVAGASAGTCIIIASQPGNGQYAPADSITRSFPVQKITQTISFTPPNGAEADRRVTLSALATSKLEVSFTSDTPGVCTVSGSTVTAIAAGTCTVTASQAGDDRYLAARDVTQSFRVNAGHQAQTITFPDPPETKVGEAVTVSASATSGLLVAFRSDTPRICTVSGSTLTPVAAGTCTVTASQGGSDHYAAARNVAQSFDVTSATSMFPGALTILLGAAVFAAAGATALVRRIRRARRRSHRPPEPQPSVHAAPVPGPPTLVSVQNTGTGPTHTVRIESSPGARLTTIKEGRP